MLSAEYIQLLFRLLFTMEANTMNPDQTAPNSSLIWVHIVCNLSYQSKSEDEQADDTCYERWEKGLKCTKAPHIYHLTCSLKKVLYDKGK